MRFAVLIFVAPLLIAFGGYALCTAMHADPHPREMLIAGGINFLAAVAAIAPVITLRNSTTGTLSQVALVGTLIHMMLALLATGALVVTRAVPLTTSLYVWMLVFYWTLLSVLVAAMVSMVKAARPDERPTA